MGVIGDTLQFQTQVDRTGYHSGISSMGGLFAAQNGRDLHRMNGPGFKTHDSPYEGDEHLESLSTCEQGPTYQDPDPFPIFLKAIGPFFLILELRESMAKVDQLVDVWEISTYFYWKWVKTL